jgi:hypothetical protein
MSKEYLFKTAKKLKLSDLSVAEEFTKKRNILVEKINKIMLERQDLDELIGKKNTFMMLDNHNNHSRFIETILYHYEPDILVKTVLWVFVAYRTHGFNLTYWPAQLNAWLQVYKEELSDKSYDTLEPLYNWMLNNQALFAELRREYRGRF